MRPLFVVVLLALAAAPSLAYPSMIAHGYTACASCHVDPSGSGALTAYGRGMSDLLVRWHLDPAEVESGEPSPTAGYLWGLLTPPEWLNPSGNLRGGGMVVVGSSTAVVPLAMALDLNATVDVAPVVAHVSLGFGPKNQGPAVVISPDPSTGALALVSREHWLGVRLLDDSLVLRAGRLQVPFGLRNPEHTSFVRAATRTDTNTDQQHGVAVAFANDRLRTEVMGLLGNYQIRPDAVRERGYTGYVEVFPMAGLGLGASSLLTWANQDLDTSLPTLRQAHGLFARYAPVEPLALLFEGDALIDTAFDDAGTGATTVGGAGWLQADWTVLSGLHLMPAVEGMVRGDSSVAGWLSAAWHPLPHTELRADTSYRQSFAAAGGTTGSFFGLLQLHLYL